LLYTLDSLDEDVVESLDTWPDDVATLVEHLVLDHDVDRIGLVRTSLARLLDVTTEAERILVAQQHRDRRG